MSEAYSDGTKKVWQMAGNLAVSSGSSEIEPCHFLLAMCDLTEAEGENSAFGVLQAEVERLKLLFRQSRLDVQTIKTLLRTHCKTKTQGAASVSQIGVRAARSLATKQAFETATDQSKTGKIDIVELLGAICISRNAEVQRFLGDQARTLAENASRMRENASFESSKASVQEKSLGEPLAKTYDDSDVTVLEQVDASIRVNSTATHGAVDRLASICELAWESGTKESADHMLNKVLAELLRIVPAAERGVILAYDKREKEWILKAHSAGTTPKFSMTSIRQAVDQKKGFLWRKDQNLSRSQEQSKSVAGIYVPMLVNGEVSGVIGLESTHALPKFNTSDLQLVVAVAHQLGLSIAHNELRDELAASVKILERLMANFSPKVRTRLLQRARQGKLKLGGERAVVTILCSDIRGFTRLSANMEADEVGDLLNDYFSALTESVLRHDGTINNFVGDAILAVFGSPEEDPKHCRKAVATALEMQEVAREVSKRRALKGEVVCEIGIGIHCGEVVHGFIGSADCMTYTVIGDPVNFAARYCDGAKAGEILISPGVHQRVWDAVEAEKTAITTKHEGDLLAYRILKFREGATSKG